METKKFSIPNISCRHCVMTIKNELSEINGITNVEGDPDSKTITVKWDSPATLDAIKEKLKQINYPASE
ncbi:MAG: heavy-metal-associated domain-containing protein [Spirochaetes bacterium]|nr:heavy-metal-associated domain-containing protein [Spirochaetota bacterium]